MSLKGWGIALILAPFTLGISFILYGYYWFFKKVGKWYVRGLKIFFLMPLAIVLYAITRIIEGIIGDVEWIVSIFTGGLKNMEVPEGEESFISIPGLSQFKIRYLFAFALALYVDWVLFIEPLVSGGVPELSIMNFTSFLYVGLPFFFLVVMSGLIAKYQGVDMTNSAKELSASGVAAGAGAAGAAAAAPGAAAATGKEAAGQAAELAERGAGMYEDIEVAEAAEVFSSGGAAASGAEGILASVGGSSIVTVGGPVVLVAIGLWIVYSILAIIMSAVLLGATWGYVSQLLPLIAGPIMGAIGLGTAYGEWFGESTSNSVGPQLDNAFEEEKAALGQLGARIGCVLEGPQCLRQWQMNNTVRPGSEDVGEEYELRVSEFGLGVERVDTAYKEKDYTLPINFLIENTRNGIKGITADDVEYKIELKDDDKTYCSTADGVEGEWRSINSQGLEADAAVEEDVNYILPGLGVSPTESLEELNLADCELLQPSMGVNRVLEMQIRYDYSSQATLYFDAMSREHRRDEGITPEFQESETARTPVQSYLNVQAPATYYETAGGDRRAVPFTARFGFGTDAGVDYRVDPESIRIVDSDMTEETSECSGLRPLEDDNAYTVSDRAEERINIRQEEDNQWFSSNTEPSPLRCTMELSDPDQISETGEELLMRLDADYTVRMTEEMESFSVWNTQCDRNNCPFAVTEQYNESSDANLESMCDGTDGRDGCSVRVPEDGESEIDWARLNLAERDGNDITIKEDHRAFRILEYINDFKDRIGRESAVTEFVEDNPDMPVGVPEEEVQEVISETREVVLYENNNNDENMNNLRVEPLPGPLCQQHIDEAGLSGTEAGLEDYLNQWKEVEENAGSEVQAFSLMSSPVDCERSIAETLADSGSCAVTRGGDLVDAIVNWDTDEFENEEECMDYRERVRACSTGDADVERGVLVEDNDEVMCYGGTIES